MGKNLAIALISSMIVVILGGMTSLALSSDDLTDQQKQLEIQKLVDNHRSALPTELVLAIICQEGGEGAFQIDGWDYNTFYSQNDGPWAQPTNGDGIMQVTTASGHHEKCGPYTHDQSGYDNAINDGCDYLLEVYGTYETYVQTALHYNTGPNTLYIYLGRNWGDRNYLSNVAAHLSSFVPNTYGLQNQNLVESLNQGQSILDDYLYNRGIETGQSLDYYSQYQVQLDNDLNNILDSDSANLQTDLITLTLYVHEGSASGPVIPGALITGNDGSSNSFQQTTDNSGYVIIEGDPGTWSFSVSSAGYETSNWDQDINEDDIKDAFLQQEQDQDITLTLYIHDGSASGPIIPDAQVTGWDGSGNSFEKTSSSSGYVTIAGFPGIWSFSVSADGYETNSWDQEITETDTKDAYLQKSTGQPSATGFDLEYPIGVPRILGGTGYVTETSTGWHNAQDWSEYNPDYSGYHPGEDWNYGSGTDDFGEPVYAIAAGTVFDTRDALFNDKSGYGSGIAIEHMLPNSERIYSLYEHIDITAGLSIGDSVSQADRIGSIADTSKLSPHLHFEIRTKQVDTDDWYPNDNGYGYYDSIDSLYADGLTINPSDFIDSHRHVAPEESEPKPEASNPPIVQTFNVTPISVDFGESFAVNYTVSDNSRSGLKQVELWRKDEESDWQQISAKTLAGEIGSISGSLTDSPTAPGKYWYGVHVVDNADNWNDQKNSNTNGQPSSFEPIEVEVKAASREIDQISEAHELQRFKHNVDVSSMAFSPDGAKLATIDGFSDYNYSGIARIWDVATGAELQRMNLEDKMRSVIRSVFSKVIFSPDGKKIGTAGTTTVQIWDVATGAELQRMNCGQEVVSAAFSPDFTKVATANDDYRVRIWDVATGAELIELNPYTPETIAYYEVKTVVFSPDGSKVAVCHGGTVQIWDVSSGAEIQKIKDAGESVLLFSPDGSKVATTTSNPFANKFYARIWDVTNGAELQRLNHEAPVGSIDFQQEGNKIVTECSSTALIWDVATGAELKMLDHSSPVQFVSFSRDGSKLATTSYWNDTVRIWDATTGAEIQKLPQKSDHLSNPSPTSILFSRDGSKMAVSVSDETVRIWDITA